MVTSGLADTVQVRTVWFSAPSRESKAVGGRGLSGLTVVSSIPTQCWSTPSDGSVSGSHRRTLVAGLPEIGGVAASVQLARRPVRSLALAEVSYDLMPIL